MPLPASFSDTRLHTRRLELRPLQPGDEHDLLRIFGDPEFMRYWSTGPWQDLDRARRVIERDLRELAAGEHLRLGIVARDSGRLIGTCSMLNIVPSCRRAEIGYGIARDQWRQGYMHEAVSALIDQAFGAFELHRLEADVDPRNVASARSLEKLGFRREGLLRERWIVDGEVSDSALYGLLAHEWRAAGDAPGNVAP
jgi:[ribosomal protein S5]-alanine N-acetyltransferase